MSAGIIALLLGFIVIREALFQFTMHKMINKVMSRNYHEYQAATALNDTKELTEEPKEEQMDLGYLDEFIN